MLKSSLALSLVASTAASVQTLTSENFADQTTSKGAFVKFFAPWCGHCKAMKPDWDTLGKEHAGSETHLIGDVDCTVEKELCSAYNVNGFPTLKYFPAGSSEAIDYEGGRKLEDLRDFAANNLGPTCCSQQKDLCSEDDLVKLEELEALGAEEVARRMGIVEESAKRANQIFKDELDNLQQTYERIDATKNEAVDAAKVELRWLKRVSF